MYKELHTFVKDVYLPYNPNQKLHLKFTPKSANSGDPQ